MPGMEKHSRHEAGDRLSGQPARGESRSHWLLRPFDGIDAYLVGRPLGASAEVPCRQLLLADLCGDPSRAHVALLSEFRARAEPIRRHARYRGADRAARRASQLWRNRPRQPDRRSPPRRDINRESLRHQPGHPKTSRTTSKPAPATSFRKKCGGGQRPRSPGISSADFRNVYRRFGGCLATAIWAWLSCVPVRSIRFG